jgi:opine dehydrogenase
MSDSMHESGTQKVVIVGAGAIAFATSALLAESGHRPMLWSPSGMGTLALSATGNLSVERNPTSGDAQPGIQQWTISPLIATSAHALVD